MKKLFILLFLIVSLNLSAETYYISPSGSNKASGSSVSPWKTLTYACSKAISGDVIHVKAGTYIEIVQSVIKAGVSIEGEGDSSYIICRYNNGNEDDMNNAALQLSSASQTVDGNQSISYIKFDGNLTSRRAIHVKWRNHVEIHHCSFVDFYRGCIHLDGQTSWRTPPSVWSDGNKVYNNTITNSSTYTEGLENMGSIKVTGQINCEVYNNTVSQLTRGVGICGTDLMSIHWIKNTVIHHNNFHSLASATGSPWNFSIESWDCWGGVEIYSNNFFGSGTISIGGIETKRTEYTFAVKIYDNEFILPSQQQYEPREILAICLEAWRSLSDIYVYNNHIKNFGSGIQITLGNDASAYQHIGTIENVYIYNNIIENVGYANDFYGYGIATKWQSAKINVRYNNLNIWNNTITGNTPYSKHGISFDIDCQNSDISVRNNIIQGFKLYPIIFYSHNGSVDKLVITNNIYSKNGTDAVNLGGVTPSVYTSSPNYTSDPLLTSDFHLKATSPAIGKGVSVGLKTDKDGAAWKGTPSIGAYEYGSVILPVVQKHSAY